MSAHVPRKRERPAQVAPGAPVDRMSRPSPDVSLAALVALPEDAEQLQHVVTTATDSGVRTAVRSSGHNIAGSGSVDGGLVIDIRRLDRVVVDPLHGTARVGGGATWGQFDAATSRYGLATTGGTFDTTGVAGLTLGGGIGHLMGRFGLSCDNVSTYRLPQSLSSNSAMPAEKYARADA